MQIKLQQQIWDSYYRSPTRILDMSFDEQREFLKQFFHGRRDRKTRPEFGIFVKVNEGDKEHPFKFSMKGKFGIVKPAYYDHLPMGEQEMVDMMTGACDVPKKKRAEILSKLNLNSRYGVCLQL
jgi:hypothetical protein